MRKLGFEADNREKTVDIEKIRFKSINWPEGILKMFLSRISSRFLHITLFLLIILFFASAAQAQTPSPGVEFTDQEKAWLKQHHTVRARVGQAPPLHFYDGKYYGISVDYLNLIAERAGFKVQYMTDISWTNALDHINKHEVIDLLLTAKVTQERKSIMAFTEDYLFIPWVIFTRKDSGPLNAIKELVGKKVSVEKDYIMHKKLDAEYPGIELVIKKTSKEALEAVATGLVDAYIGNLATATHIIQHQNYSNLKVAAPTPFGSHNQAMAIRDDWPELAGIINKIIAAMTPDEHTRIKKRWLAIEVEIREQSTVDLTNEEKNFLNRHPKLRLGVDPDYPPFDFLDENKKHVGIAADYIKLIAKMLNIEMEAVQGQSWKQVLEGAKARTIDVVPLLAMTKPREAYLGFTKPYITYPNAIIVRSDYPPIEGLRYFNGKKVAVVEGYKDHDHLIQYNPEVLPYPVSNTLEGMKAVLKGEAEAFIGSFPVTSYVIQKNSLVGLKLTTFVEEWEKNEFRIGVRKDWPELIAILNKALDSIPQEEHQKIINRWISLKSTEFKIKSVQLTEKERIWLAKHKTLRLGVDPAWPPYDFVDEQGAHRGLSADILDLVSLGLGVSIKLIPNLTWSQALQGVQDRTVDILSIVTETPKRKSYLKYSKPLINMTWVIVTRNDFKPIQNLGDLIKDRVAMADGYAVVEASREKYPVLPIVIFNTSLEALIAVATGQADAYVGYLGAIGLLLREHNLTNLKVAADAGFPPVPMKIGVRSDWPELVPILNKALAAIPLEMRNEINRKWVPLELGEEKKFALTKGEMAWLSEHKNLRLGITPTWAPFQYFDADGKHAGITSDYIHILNNRLGVEITAVKGLTWAEVLEKAKTGEIDVISAIVKTRERSEFLLFTDPYARLPLVMITRKDAPYIEGVEALKDGTIAIVRGYATQYFIERDFPDQDLLLVDSMDQALTAVSEGSADAMIDNIASVAFFQRKLGITNLKVAATTPYSYDLSFAVKKDLPQLVPILNKALAAFTDQEKEIIQDKWVNIRIEKRVDWRMLQRYILLVIVIFGIILSLILFWNRRLAGEITERKRAEGALRESEAAARGLLDATQETLLLLDKDGVIIAANQTGAVRFLKKPDELIGINVFSLMPSELQESRRANFDEVIKSRTAKEFEDYRIGMYLLSNFYPVMDERGNVTAVAVFSQDITERKKAEEELKSNLDELERFNRLSIGREQRMIRLKEEINDLRRTAGQTDKYKIVD